MIEEQTKALLPRELAKWVKNGFPGSSFTVNLETPNSNYIVEVAEGAEIPMTAMLYSTVTFTPIKYGAAVRITREMMEDSQFELFQSNIGAVGRRLAEKETDLILTALDGAGTTVSGGAQITMANITEGIKGIEDNDYTATDLIVGNEVAQDLRNMDLFIQAQMAGNTQMISTGFIGTIYGLNVVRFSVNAAPSSTYSKYAYIIDRSQTYGIAIKRNITVENFELANFDMSGAAVTMRLDVKLLRANSATNITTS
jgi:HK97 family phage major capsid protein